MLYLVLNCHNGVHFSSLFLSSKIVSVLTNDLNTCWKWLEAQKTSLSKDKKFSLPYTEMYNSMSFVLFSLLRFFFFFLNPFYFVILLGSSALGSYPFLLDIFSVSCFPVTGKEYEWNWECENHRNLTISRWYQIVFSYINATIKCFQEVHSVQSLSHVQLFVTPWMAAQARPPCPSPTPRVYSNSCPSSRWCHADTSSSVIPFSSCLQSFPASGSFPVSQFFTSGGQSVGVSTSTSVLSMNIQDWFPLG